MPRNTPSLGETLKFPLTSLTLKRGEGRDDRWTSCSKDQPKRILFAAVNSLISVYVRENSKEGMLYRLCFLSLV